MAKLFKPKQYNIAETNLALFGTPLEREVKKEAALCDPEWNGLAKSAPVAGIRVWRIEKFHVKKWARVGEFYTGDSFIVLHSYKGEKDRFSYDVHFWLGAGTTPDEAGTAAYKTVELDDALGGVPVQHREVEGHESELFLSYFAKSGGIRILEGGIETGFNHVKPTEYRPRLLHIKGKRHVRVIEVPITHKSLNSGDVFLLDAGLKLFIWQGSKCSGPERQKGGQLAQALDDERGGKPEKVYVSETDKPTDGDAAEFWKLLGGVGPIAPADNLDDVWEEPKPNKLFRISDEGGALKVTLVAEGAITHSKLESKDAFLLDVGCQLFVWIGKGASKGERAKGLALAQDYAKKNNRPAFLPLTRVLEGGENQYFKTYLAGEKRKF